jgi:thiol-disulfide isomerase/thioredoxin
MKVLNLVISFHAKLLLSLMIVGSLNANAQAGKIPPFRMLQGDSKVFKAENLPMGKPIIIIYFSPDCDHCDKMMKELSKKSDEFKKASIAMITYLAIDKVIQFEKTYELKKYQNIYVGTEGNTFFVKNYYRITNMPFIALYTKNGDLVKEYRNEGALADLSIQLNKL